MTEVAAVVLAAGRARRFGATKQVASVAGRPLVAHAVVAALAAGADDVVVVVGHDGARVRDALPDDARVRTVDNPDHAAGQSTSLRAGLAALGDDMTAAVILLADEPTIDAAVIEQVVEAWREHGGAARANYADGPGHPVVFDRSLWPRLDAAVFGDRGARDLFDELPVTEVAVVGLAPLDVDAPDDLP